MFVVGEGMVVDESGKKIDEYRLLDKLCVCGEGGMSLPRIGKENRIGKKYFGNVVAVVVVVVFVHVDVVVVVTLIVWLWWEREWLWVNQEGDLTNIV